MGVAHRQLGVLVAEIRGVDVATASDDEIRAIRAALIEYKVIVLRDQPLDDASTTSSTACPATSGASPR